MGFIALYHLTLRGITHTYLSLCDCLQQPPLINKRQQHNRLPRKALAVHVDCKVCRVEIADWGLVSHKQSLVRLRGKWCAQTQ